MDIKRIRAKMTMLVLFIALGGPSVFALDPRKAVTQYVHHVWQAEAGLPQNSVLAITQTRDGYLWLGTYEGLARFDGARFTVFDKANTENIKDNNILALCEDREGGLWIGTYGGGLSRWKDGTFANYTAREGLANDLVMCLSAARDGSLWVGTTGGLSHFKNGRFTTYTTKQGLSDDYVMSICEDHEGALWIATRGGGLNRFKDGRFTATTIKDGLPTNYIRWVYEDRQSNLWIGTWGGGLCRLKDGRITTCSTKDGLPNDMVRCIYEDRDGNLWIGTGGGGLVRFRISDFGFRIGEAEIRHPKSAIRNRTGDLFSTEDGLPDDLVMAICEDREGSLWIGTNTGLCQLKDGKFTTYTTREGLPDDDIWSVSQDRAGALWIGTDSHGLVRFKDGRFTVYTTRDGLSRNSVFSICEDRAGALWIGTGGGGLDRFQNGRFTSYTTREGLSGNTVLSLYEDRAGALWIGTDGGLDRLKDGTFTTYALKEGSSSYSVNAIYEDRDGSLWFGTEGGGLHRLKNGAFAAYTMKDGLASDKVWSFYQDQTGALWIGTDGGLNRFKDGTFTRITTQHGLFNDVVFQMLDDGRGNLWMSCQKGVFHVSRRELDEFAEGRTKAVHSVAYGTADGLKSTECNGTNQPSAWKAQDGTLWFPTIRGVAMIDAARVTINSLPPPVIIEQIKADDDRMTPAGTIVFGPGKETFEFHYTALSLLSPEKVRFKYQLEGFDHRWAEAEGRRVAYYTNLPPGEYRFRVIACNNDGVWNDTGAMVEFHLQPYFHQTTSFYALCVLGVLVAGMGAYQWRVRHLKARQRELASLVRERTHQLREANETLQRLATTDELTAIANHRRFKEFFDLEWQRAARAGAPVSAIMIDIDFFKAYNDAYGHQAGDECLRRVARTLSQALNRPTDLLARYGGEEFVAVLADTDADGATVVAEQMRRQVESLNVAHSRSGVSDHVTISLGVATTVPGGDSVPAMLIAAADQALYQAKQEGRNRVKIGDAMALYAPKLRTL